MMYFGDAITDKADIENFIDSDSILISVGENSNQTNEATQQSVPNGHIQYYVEYPKLKESCIGSHKGQGHPEGKDHFWYY